MLTVVGVSYHLAPVELRELVAVQPTRLDESLRSLGNAIILTTCNRTEIYQDLPESQASYPARDFLLGQAGAHRSEIADCLYSWSGEVALRHLFIVAAGLDSMILGEAQILGQIREALDAAVSAATTTPILQRAFRDALRVGRRARAETFIGRHAMSVSYAAVELARDVFGKLSDRRAIVVGAGEAGELTTRTLVDHGVTVTAVANRTRANAEQLVARFGGVAVGLDDLPTVLTDADIVLSATDSPGYVVSREAIATVAEARPERPLFLFDMAVPRDVEPTCGELPNVFLYGLDDLKARCEANRDRRGSEIQPVHALIDDEVRRFSAWERTRSVLPTVIALRERAERFRRDELAEALAHLPHLNDADRQVLDNLSRAVVNKLLHEPTVRLKATPDDATLVTVINHLFDLADET